MSNYPSNSTFLCTHGGDKLLCSKNLQNITELTHFKIKKDTSIETPIIYISNSYHVLNYNYMYLADTQRFYFINDIILKEQMYEIHLDEDYLMTWYDSYINESYYIERQEKNFNGSNNAFFDELYPVREDTYIDIESVGTVSNGANFYLTVNGGI